MYQTCKRGLELSANAKQEDCTQHAWKWDANEGKTWNRNHRQHKLEGEQAREGCFGVGPQSSVHSWVTPARPTTELLPKRHATTVFRYIFTSNWCPKTSITHLNIYQLSSLALNLDHLGPRLSKLPKFPICTMGSTFSWSLNENTWKCCAALLSVTDVRHGQVQSSCIKFDFLEVSLSLLLLRRACNY